MSFEIERRFLVDPTKIDLRDLAQKYERHEIKQGYLSMPGSPGVVRIRAVNVYVPGEAPRSTAFITVKSKYKLGMSREFEYGIPPRDAAILLKECAIGAVIEKMRYHDYREDHVYEIDEFHGIYTGLLVAEVELEEPGETIVIPPYCTTEITGASELSNFSMAMHVESVKEKLAKFSESVV